MKVSLSSKSDTKSAMDAYKPVSNKLVNLVPESFSELNSRNSTSFKLLTVPSNASSQKYNLVVQKIQGGESVETLINWYLNVKKVIVGTNATEHAAAVALVEATATGTPLMLFQGSITEQRQNRFVNRQNNASDN